MPRRRWYLKLRATVDTPFASRAEASVSPAKPDIGTPSKLKSIGRAAVDASAGRQAISAHGSSGLRSSGP
jgi:hypothetical protein